MILINILTRGITTALCILLLGISSHLFAQGTQDENAHYELATRIFNDGLYADAAREYKQFIINYPTSKRLPDAMLRVGRLMPEPNNTTSHSKPFNNTSTAIPATSKSPVPCAHAPMHSANSENTPEQARPIATYTPPIPPRQTRPRTSYQPARTTTKAAPYQKRARPIANSENNIPNRRSSTKPPSTWAASSSNKPAPKKPSRNFAPSPNVPVLQSASPTPSSKWATSPYRATTSQKPNASLQTCVPDIPQHPPPRTRTSSQARGTLAKTTGHALKKLITTPSQKYRTTPAANRPCWAVQMQNANSAKAAVAPAAALAYLVASEAA